MAVAERVDGSLSHGRCGGDLRHCVAGQVCRAALAEGSRRYPGTLPVSPSGAVGTGAREAQGKECPLLPGRSVAGAAIYT